jgi:hypothetical protein
MPAKDGFVYLSVPITKEEKAEYDAIRERDGLATAPVHVGRLIREFIRNDKEERNAGE